MTGVIEFLRKAKAIQNDNTEEGYAIIHDLVDYICDYGTISEADLVRKVMDYQIKEDNDDKH